MKSSGLGLPSTKSSTLRQVSLALKSNPTTAASKCVTISSNIVREPREISTQPRHGPRGDSDYIQATGRLSHLHPVSVKGHEGNKTSHLKQEVYDEGEASIEGKGIHSRHVG
ncbi:hypothetical protein E2C01_016080 [Portunus trituberculatus]|uniref:Uncharacterized protein n=1 Tax=Portunus trituberculatus TaxID=210409 RepID=A0A5B7DQ00_PORTR|nr:hypothetical protein [Portunus trituberculatus]